jgi:ATPase subunit of ABC transporter with duplicated ATPase domains
MMKVRETKIVAAHTNTFEWIFEDTGTKKPTSFVDWLTNQDGIYWIMGKAGSGKSTLMKFLASHRRTRKELLRWTGADNILVMASFFFWSAGTVKRRPSAIVAFRNPSTMSDSDTRHFY